MQFLWRFFVIGARVLALAVFASQFQIWVFVIVGVHWIAMVTWIQLQRAKFCQAGPAWQEVCFSMVAATIHIFCFFNLKEGHTRLRYAVYYFIIYTENMIMALLWYMVTQTQEFWYHIPCMVMILLGFIVGVVLQIIYYLKFHPNNKITGKEIKFWVPCGDLQCMGGQASAPGSPLQFSRSKSLRRSTRVPMQGNKMRGKHCHHRHRDLDLNGYPGMPLRREHTVPLLNPSTPERHNTFWNHYY